MDNVEFTGSIEFFTLDPDGTTTHTRTINNADIARCPTYIMLPDHYRLDGSCRHNEPMCEFDGCHNLKSGDEIYCDNHLEGW